MTTILKNGQKTRRKFSRAGKRLGSGKGDEDIGNTSSRPKVNQSGRLGSVQAEGVDPRKFTEDDWQVYVPAPF